MQTRNAQPQAARASAFPAPQARGIRVPGVFIHKLYIEVSAVKNLV
jgi:hypothetical protein